MTDEDDTPKLPVPLPDGQLAVLAYTGKGFVPAVIDARPIKDVSAIRFLGTEVAETHPEVKSWQVPGPATVDDEKLVTKKGPYRPLENLELGAWLRALAGAARARLAGGRAADALRRAHRGDHAGDALVGAEDLEDPERLLRERLRDRPPARGAR